MTDFNELRAGAPIAGLYAAKECTQQEGGSAFLTVETEDGNRFLMRLLSAEAWDSENQFAVWQRARHLRHRNLLYLRDLGRTEIEGLPYIYAVFENPDDSLAAALRQGPLTEGETKGVFAAALSALRYLHGQGMVHGAVDADHIVAAGDDIKLTTDGLREADDLGEPLEDVRQLGELAYAMRSPEPLGEPLASVVPHATMSEPRQRWTLAEIASAIEERQPPPRLETVSETIAPPPISVTEPEPQSKVEFEFRNVRPPRAIPKWPFAAAAFLLLFILVLNSRRKPETPRAVTAAPVAMKSVAASAVSAAPMDTRTWRVVAFSYGSRRSATRKARQINRRWPELQAAVCASKARRGHYLVTLGEPMDRAHALELQGKAHDLGLDANTELQD